jgi:hypothetical protein
LLFIFLCLAAGFAPLRRRVAALAEKCLIVGCKCKVLSAVAAGKLQVPSHNGSLISFVPSGEFLRLCIFLSRYAEKKIVRKSEQRLDCCAYYRISPGKQNILD